MIEPVSCLSVVMPSYNEAATLETVIRRVLVVPVRPGADRRGRRLRRRHGRRSCASIDDPRIRLFVQPINLGQGRRAPPRVRRGDRAVRDRAGRRPRVRPGGVRRPCSARSSRATPTSSTGRASSPATPHRVLYYWHSVGNRFLTTASNMFTNLNLTDMETCYKAFRREVIQSIEIEEDRFGFEPEITAKIAAAGWRIYEVGISYSGRTYSEGKKIGWKDGVRAIYGVVRYSDAWHGVRGCIDHAPDRSIPPAEFDDSDAELSDVLRHARGSRQLRRLDLPADPAVSRRARARDRCRARRADRTAAPRREGHGDGPLQALRRRARAAVRGLPRGRGAAGRRRGARRRGPEVRFRGAHQRARAHRRRRRRARRPPRGAEAGRPALRVRARVRGPVLRVRPAHRPSAALPAQPRSCRPSTGPVSA